MNLQVYFKLLPLFLTNDASDTQLANTEEYQDGKSNGALGEVFVRYGVLVLFIVNIQSFF
jgi:hypothetical protein